MNNESINDHVWGINKPTQSSKEYINPPVRAREQSCSLKTYSIYAIPKTTCGSFSLIHLSRQLKVDFDEVTNCKQQVSAEAQNVYQLQHRLTKKG